MKRVIVVAGLGILALGTALVAEVPAAVAADPAMTEMVEKRIKSMKQMRRAMSRTKKMVKKGDFDSAKAAEYAKSLMEETRLIVDYFPKGSNVDPTEAKAEVWSSWPEFEAMAKDSVEAADKFAGATNDKGTAKSAYNELRATCDDCHDKFLEE